MAVAEGLGVSRLRGQGGKVQILLSFIGWLIGSYLVTMLAWVVVPAVLFGWNPMVVVSGSMEPRIRTGDVVLTEEVDPLIGPGSIVAYDVGDGVVLHRVTGFTVDGAYQTQGDANVHPDSIQVRHDDVIGVGRLLVPYVGLARTWSWGWWAVLGVLGLAALPLWRRGTGLPVAIIVAVLAVTGLVAASALFSTTTGNGSSSISAIEVQPPTALDAACGVVGAGVVPVDVTWTASPTSGVTGYRVLHDGPAPGINYSEVGIVGPGVTSFTHDIPQELLSIGTHTYAVEAELTPWRSDLSGADAVDVTQLVSVYACTEL